jgi:hypothetical protein
MTRIPPSLDRLEARIDRQAARIDALYRTLEARGIIPGPADAGRGDAFFDELVQIEDAPVVRERRARSVRRRAVRLHVGNSTGV